MTEPTQTTEWRHPELSEELVAELKIQTRDGLLYTRVYNGLLNAGVRTKEDILRLGRVEFHRQPNLGKKSISVIGKIVGKDWSDPRWSPSGLAAKAMVGKSTCADRLRMIAAQPEYAAIKWELLHAAAELDGMREVLRQHIDPNELAAFEQWVKAEKAKLQQ